MSGKSMAMLLVIVVSCGPVRAQEAGLVKEGDSAFAKGDYDAARRSFEKALQIAGDSTARYGILRRLTSTSAAVGQFAEAQRYLQQAITGPDDPKLADDLVLSVNLDMRTKEYDHALVSAQQVEAMHVASYTSESLPVADDLLRIGEIYLAQAKLVQAMGPLLDAHGIRTRLNGPLDPGLLAVLDRINEANAKIAGGSGAFAGHTNEAFYRQALAIRETLYGENSSELISTVEGLANLYSAELNLIAAEPVYLRLLALWESAAGKDHPMVAVTLDKLVVFYIKEGQPEKAREALARSVAIRAHFLAVGLSLQAEDAISVGHQEQAKTLYNRALVALGPPGATNDESAAEIRKALAELRSSPAK
jgi:tetratricopeptide (TPR) repeat protein